MPNEQQRGRQSGTSESESSRGIVGERDRYGTSPRPQRGPESTAVGQRRRGYPSSYDSPEYRGAFLASPWELMRRMSEDLDRLFDTFQPGRFQGQGGASGALWAPDLEVERRGKELCVRADLPGLKPEDIEVSLDDGVLTISGERRREQRDEREGMLRSERSYGRFVRSLQVPDGVDESEIAASFRDGVLEITIPVPERQQRKIQVKS